MKTRHLLAASVAALMAAGPAMAQQTITWWDFLSGGDGVRMKALIEEFNEEHPDIQIEATTLEWGVPFYTKVRTSAAARARPYSRTSRTSPGKGL